MAWPSIRADFRQPLSGLGLIVAAYTAGGATGSTMAARVAARLGTGGLLLMATGAGMVGLSSYVLAPTWPLLLAGSVLLGLRGGLLDAGINAWVAARSSARGLNLLHACWGIGATVGPLLLTVAVTSGWSWRLSYALLLVVEVSIGVAYWRVRTAWAVGAPEPEEAGLASTPARRVVVLSVALFLVYVGIEATAGAWAYSLLTDERRVPPGVAGAWVAGYWGCLTAGRLLAGAAGHRTTPERIVVLSTGGAVVGAGLFWWNPVTVIGLVGLGLLGLAFAALYPTWVALTPGRVGAAVAPTVIGYQVAAGAIAAGVVPAAAGLVFERVGLEALGPVLVAGAVLLVVLDQALTRTPSTSTSTLSA